MRSIDLHGRPEFFHGIAALESADGGLYAARMTPELREFYRRQSEMWYFRAVGGAGVSLEFRTAARKLAMRFKLGVRSRDFFGFDVVCDGRLAARMASPTPRDVFEFAVDLPGAGVRTTAVHFPYEVESFLESMELDDDAVLEPVIYPEAPIVFIGDSITQGMEAVAPGETYAVQLARKLGRDSVNLSVGGMRMLAEPTRHALNYRWDTAILAYGVNDSACRTPLPTFREQTIACLRLLTSRPGAKVRLFTPIPWPAQPQNHPAEFTLEHYRRTLTECAQIFPAVKVVDGAALLENDVRYFADGVHPNAGGMARMASRLYDRLKGLAAES